MASNIYSFYSLNNYLTLERNFYFCFSFSNYFCCSSYSPNLVNIAQDLLIMIPISYYLLHILHSIDFFRKAITFPKINSALNYYGFSYVDMKYLNKYQQCFVHLLTEWCVLFSVVYFSMQGSFLYCSIVLLIATVAAITY